MEAPRFTIGDGINSMEVSAEEFAAMWGADEQYRKPPMQFGDLTMFYNFGSERLERTLEWLTAFEGAILRTIEYAKMSHHTSENDIEDLGRLLKWVQYLKEKAA